MIIRACKFQNFGDSINTPLVKAISGIDPIIVNHSFQNLNNETIYMVVGSILGWMDSNSIVWGSGFLTDSFLFSKEPPKQICAVRGKLTRNILIGKGINCPKIYGDPVLLMSKFYKCLPEKKHKLGIICHHVDKILIPQLKLQFPDAYFIDIQADIYKVIEDICICEKIISSALHGVIAADTYGIPSIWVKFSDKVLGKGFKFMDYFSSINRKDIEPLIWTKNITLNDIDKKFTKWNKMELDLIPLWESCPFKKGK